MRWANLELQPCVSPASAAISLKYHYFCNFSQIMSCTLRFLGSVRADHFNIQLAELQVYSKTMSIQMMCPRGSLLHHLQPEPLPESTKSEQSRKPNHTFIQENKSKMSPSGYGLKAGPASKLCSAFPVVLNQASANSRKQSNESNQRGSNEVQMTIQLIKI